MAANQISKIEGLTHLKKLAFLDLSQNQIKSFDIGMHVVRYFISITNVYIIFMNS